MAAKMKRVMELMKKRELISFAKEKYQKVFWIHNKVIRNYQRKEEVYRKLKTKYTYVLENFKHEKSEKSNKVWVCWLQGEENAPALVKKCLQSIRKYLKEKEIVMISNENFKDYIQFPEYILEKFNKGIIPYAQFADLIRVSLLAQYGGLWLDATVLCTGEVPDYILNAEMFVYKEVLLDRTDELPIVASNWLLSSYAHNDIMRATQKLLFAYWEKENRLKHYFIFHLFFKMATEKFAEQWKAVPTFSNTNPHILQFELLDDFDEKRWEQIKQISSIHKLNKAIRNQDKSRFTFYDYILSIQ